MQISNLYIDSSAFMHPRQLTTRELSRGWKALISFSFYLLITTPINYIKLSYTTMIVEKKLIGMLKKMPYESMSEMRKILHETINIYKARLEKSEVPTFHPFQKLFQNYVNKLNNVLKYIDDRVEFETDLRNDIELYKNESKLMREGKKVLLSEDEFWAEIEKTSTYIKLYNIEN